MALLSSLLKFKSKGRCLHMNQTQHDKKLSYCLETARRDLALILFIQTLALYKSFTYLLTYLFTRKPAKDC